MLSSDGLHDLADDQEFLPGLAIEDPERACAALITLARDRGAPDNVTVCIVDVMETATPNVVETRVVEVPA
jgi:serine/threonine protein phosphatase PrpC